MFPTVECRVMCRVTPLRAVTRRASGVSVPPPSVTVRRPVTPVWAATRGERRCRPSLSRGGADAAVCPIHSVFLVRGKCSMQCSVSVGSDGRHRMEDNFLTYS